MKQINANLTHVCFHLCKHFIKQPFYETKTCSLLLTEFCKVVVCAVAMRLGWQDAVRAA